MSLYTEVAPQIKNIIDLVNSKPIDERYKETVAELLNAALAVLEEEEPVDVIHIDTTDLADGVHNTGHFVIQVKNGEVVDIRSKK